MLKRFENFYEDIDPFGEEDWDESLCGFRLDDIVEYRGYKGKIYKIDKREGPYGSLIGIEFFKTPPFAGKKWNFVEKNYSFLIGYLKKVEE